MDKKMERRERLVWMKYLEKGRDTMVIIDDYGEGKYRRIVFDRGSSRDRWLNTIGNGDLGRRSFHVGATSTVRSAKRKRRFLQSAAHCEKRDCTVAKCWYRLAKEQATESSGGDKEI